VASTVSTIRIAFDGSVAGLRAAAAEARAAVSSVRDQADELNRVGDKLGAGFASFAKVATILGTLGTVAPVIAGVTSALEQLLPVVLLAPAAFGVLAAAVGTWKLATAGFADAVKGDADALASLSPQARATAEAVRGLAPEFDKVKAAVQDKFFAGFSDEVRELGDTYLPILARRLPDIASGFNAMGKAVSDALKLPRTAGDIETVLTNTAKLLGKARTAAADFVSGFAGLAAIGSTYLPAIGTAINAVAKSFNDWVTRAGADGTIQRLIDDAVQGFKDLGEIILDVGDIFGAVFSALAGPQGDVLAGLRDTTGALRDFFLEASTQTALTDLGSALRDIGSAVRDVLLAALHEAAPIVADLAPVVADLAKAFGEQLVSAIHIVGPILQGIAKFLKDNRDIVVPLAEALLILYARFLLMKAATAGIKAIQDITKALGGLNGVLKLAGWATLGAIAVEVDKINVAAAGGDPENLTGLAENLHDIVGAGKEILSGNVSGILADITDELGQVKRGFTEGSSPIGAFFKTVSGNVRDFVSTTGESFDTIGKFFSDLPGKVGDALSSFGSTIKTNVDSAVGWFAQLPTRAGDALSSLGTSISTKAGEIWTGFLTTLQTTFEPVRAFFAQSPYEMGLAIGTGIGQLLAKGGELVEQLRIGAVTKFEEVRAWFATVPTLIGDALASLATTLQTKATEAGESFKTTVQTKFDEAVAWVTDLPTRIGEALGLLPTTVATKATEAGTGFQTEIQSKFDAAVAIVGGVPARAAAGLATLASEFLTKAQQAGAGFLDGLRIGGENAIAFVKGLPGQISGALGNLGGLLVNAGRAAIDGLLQGIKDGYNAMISFVSGIADGIAANKGPLPYDRKVLVPAGLALMSGLLTGLRSGNDDVQRFVATIADGIGSTLDVGSIIGTATAAAGQVRTAPTAPANAVPDLLRQLIATQGADPQVRVFIGDQELRGLVRTEVSARDRATARVVRAGSGVA
jgi:phage-related protein